MSLFAKVDPAVKAETKYIIIVVLILTALMEAVFLVIGKWDTTVLFGGLLGAATAVLNFFLMGLSVQKAVTKDEKSAAGTMKISHSMRMLMMLVICAIAAMLPAVFNLVSVLVPLLFPSVGAHLRGILQKK